jgi:hypothetical protein
MLGLEVRVLELRVPGLLIKVLLGGFNARAPRARSWFKALGGSWDYMSCS